MPDVATRAVFRQPFPEQVAFFRQKLGNLVPTARWDDLWKSQHDRGFMVAGAMKADLLADFAAAVDKAAAEGKSIEWFRKNFDDIVDRHGWAYKGERNWRTRVIYQTNISTSYAAGRLAQLKDGGFERWMYKHSDSVLHPRPHHVALDGLILPADHPFWRTHYPPNGWGCKCRVVGVASDKTARALGGDPDKQLPAGWDDIDAKTGEPVGMDKGWGYQPGETVVDTVRSLRDKLDALPSQPSIAVIQDWLRSEAFAGWFEAPDGVWPLVRLPKDDAALVGAKMTVADLSADTVTKQKREHPELTALEYTTAQTVVDNPTAKIPDQDGLSMIYVQEVDAGGRVLVVKATKTGKGLWVTSLRRLSRDEAKRDREVRRLLRKED